jgi:osmotically-inducible protein OsmY
MPRILPAIVGFLLASAVVIETPSASAQFLARFRNQKTPVRKDRYDVSNLLADENQRLAEMKVELALLGDLATFPYEFHATANGNSLQLSGDVPNDMVRQRAMDLARHSTYLRGIDRLRIQPKLSVQSTLRPPSVVQQEATELLNNQLGMPTKQISVEVRPNGVVVLSGSIDSVENKLEISRLFRRLPGCTAVANELTVEPVLIDGQRMARVTRDNMRFVPASALDQDLESAPAAPGAAVPQKKTTLPANPQLSLTPQLPPNQPAPTPLRSSNLDARESELRLPAVSAPKQPSIAAKPVREKVGDDWEAFGPSQLPVKWGRPADSWEAQAKALETAHAPSKPAEAAWTAKPAQPEDKMPTPIREVNRTEQRKKVRASTAANKTSRIRVRSSPNFAEAREEPVPVMTWRPPTGSHEESEPKSPVPTKENDDSAKPHAPKPAPALSAQSSRRWPSAYVTGTPPSKGRPGIVTFEDEPSPPSQSAPAVIATTRSPAPADLERHIKKLCGRQAREVVAVQQHDGSVLVRVKVANRSVEDQLSHKILALPEMNSSRVRLMMEIEP